MSRYNASYSGIGQLLRADFIQADMLARAELVKALAEAIAPVDTGSDHPGRYKESFSVSGSIAGRRETRQAVSGPLLPGQTRNSLGGALIHGARSRRARATVTNSAPEAIYVEYGRGAYTTTRTDSNGHTHEVHVAAMHAQRIMARALYGAAGL